MNNNKVKNGAMDLSYINLIGALWYVPIFTVIYIAGNLFFGSGQLDNLSYFSMGINSNRIFMLIMGIIIGGGFIKWAIGLGLTRRQFHKSNVYAGAIVTVGLTVVMTILSLLIGLLPFAGTEDIPQPLEMHPILNGVALTLLVYLGYLAGSLIGTGFYKSGWFGALAILITIGCNFLPETLDPFIAETFGLPEGAGLLITVILLIAVLIVLNYHFIKDIVIKV